MPERRKSLSSRPPPSPPPSLLIGLVGGLLSSSCCVVQLALNALAYGCAGFAALDKFRAPAAAATTAALVFSERRRRARQQGNVSGLLWRSVLPFALAGLLAASPEITAAVSRFGGVSGAVARAKEFAFELKTFSSSSSLSPDAAAAAAADVVVSEKKKKQKKNKVKLRLTGVKCAACGERARAAAAGAAGPFGKVSVDWLRAEATVEAPGAAGGGGAQSALLSGVIEALAEAGFGASTAAEGEEEE